MNFRESLLTDLQGNLNLAIYGMLAGQSVREGVCIIMQDFWCCPCSGPIGWQGGTVA